MSWKYGSVVEVYADIISATDEALLLDDEETWVPRSLIHPDSEVQDEGDSGDLLIPEWFAEENDWYRCRQA